MGSTERSIIEQVQSTLEGINGSSGGYNYDFSASDQVVIGIEMEPIRVPGLYLHPLNVATIQAPGKTRLRNYDRAFVIQVDCWVPATSSTPGNAILAALDGQSDVMKALENDRALGSVGVHDIEVEASAYDGAELDRPGIGVSTLLVRVTYSERAGA